MSAAFCLRLNRRHEAVGADQSTLFNAGGFLFSGFVANGVSFVSEKSR